MRSVQKTPELLRILNLPTRVADEKADIYLPDFLTEKLKTENGNMKLFPIQALALKELYENEGLFAVLAVGSGKSLISYLAPVILESKRPLLLLPKKLKKKTERELIEYGEHFKLNPIEIMSYELLSRDSGQKKFLEIAPDLIIADECHRLKNTKTAAVKRIKRYLKEHPKTIITALSGTITRNSIMDYWHILQWCLKEKAPLPESWHEAKQWSLALDEKVPFGFIRHYPGALLLFSTEEELKEIAYKRLDQLEGARNAYRRRLLSTSGILSTQKSFDGASLFIKTSVLKQNDKIKEAFKKLRLLWQTPDGIDLMYGLETSRYIEQLSCGFYYKWETPAPTDWLSARKSWDRYVRNIIQYSKRGIDTPHQVALNVTRGILKSPEYDTWIHIKDKFKPITKPVWLDDALLIAASNWLKTNKKGICWVNHVAFGKKLQEISGFSYYGEKGLNDKKEYIEDAEGPIITSVSANTEGLNLQKKWDTNLIIACPSSATIFEQMIGRTHRTGQKSDEVTVEIILGCYEDYKSILDITAEACYIRDTTGERHKILYADKEIINEEEIKKMGEKDDYCWKK